MNVSTLKIANRFGCIDIQNGVPKGYTHVNGLRLQPLCKKLKIKFAQALVGWGGTERFPKPTFDGVVVSARAAQKLIKEIEQRNIRSEKSKGTREKEKEKRKQKRDEETFRLSALGIEKGTRTYQWLKSESIDENEATLIAFKATYRHRFTDYDELLQSREREDAREDVHEKPNPDNWEKYLLTYDFPFPKIAETLAKVLQKPQSAHPVWFCEAILAVKRSEIPFEELTYTAISKAVSEWRFFRRESRED